MFKAISSSKTTQIIVDQIRDAILEGKVVPGERLQSEKELMDDFGVSKATLREALRALEYLGLIEMRKGAGGGVFVTEVDMKTTQASLVNFLHFKNVSVHHLSEIRKLLEPYAAGVAANALTAEELEELRQINQKCSEALAREQTGKTVRKEIVKFHRVIAKCTGNPLLILIIAFIENLLEDTKELLRPDKHFFQSVVEAHINIYEALVARDKSRAFEEMYKDVSRVEENLAVIQNNLQLKTD